MSEPVHHKFVKYNHHGTKVTVREDLKGKHREHCLCWRGCKHFHPDNREENCVIAIRTYDNCADHNIVTPVWECPKYEAD